MRMTDLFAVSEATWPAAARHRVGAFIIREGRCGGQRVSAATAEGRWSEADIDAAEAKQAELGQPPLFMIRDGEGALDTALAARGYRTKDPVNVYEGAITTVAAAPVSGMTGFAIWPPLAIMRDIWAEGGIGPERVAVMDRVTGPKTAFLGRVNDRASGAAFVACHGDTAMLHALHIVPDQRRQGSAVKMMRRAALWAQDQGMTRFSVLVTAANQPANALYASLGMRIVGHYHYRSK
ncbi:GNAT family N-acetyltransferase [Defluviimonas sp. SAOS-178_SWC]|uniref:GNAT family N-acetyltransferase n=1 Tax=Defluviimonas sp. SAOS-178_SWC TaxID=3121287 RepID=UPI0032217225